jgi:hypothetical protein
VFCVFATIFSICFLGSTRRATASTQMNAESSRSHLICTLIVKLTNRRSGAQNIGKLTLVDLAGSEVRRVEFLMFCHCTFLYRDWISQVQRVNS